MKRAIKGVWTVLMIYSVASVDQPPSVRLRPPLTRCALIMW